MKYVSELVVLALDTVLQGNGEILQCADLDNRSIRLLYYPEDLRGTDPLARRQSIHVDSSIITATPKSTSAGLQVELDGQLRDVNVEEQSVLILTGSILGFLTANKLKAARHTVRTPTDPDQAKDRISFIYMLEARLEAGQLSPIPSCTDPGQPLKVLDVGVHHRSYRSRASAKSNEENL